MKKAFLLLLALASTASAASPSFRGCRFDEGERSLQCKVRSLQSDEMDAQRLSSLLPRANRLSISCVEEEDEASSFRRHLHHGVQPEESVLRQAHFGPLPFLQELSLSNCRLLRLPPRAFSGLSALRSLSISNGEATSSSISLEVDPSALEGLTALEELSLAGSGVWAMPEGEMCSVPRLRVANFSSNHLTSMSDLGFPAPSTVNSKATIDNNSSNKRKDCKTAPSVLDLSHNSIQSLRPDSPSSYSSVRRLMMRGNRLEVIADDALLAMGQLQELDLANNQLAAIPPSLFSKSSSSSGSPLPLRTLLLQNNSLSLLPSGTFDGLPSLAVLNLSSNALASHLVSAGTFSGLDSLAALDLSGNSLERVDRDSFSRVKNTLQALDLAENGLRSLEEGVFAGAALKVLRLSHNSIEAIPEGVFAEDLQLESLSLDHNLLREDFPVPSSLASLSDLALNGNELTAVPRVVRVASASLKTLDLGDNSISLLEPEDLSGLDSLYGLRLAGNRLERLRNDTFSLCCSSSLHILNLGDNLLSSVEVGTFHGLGELRTLRLDGNRLEDLNGLVSSLGNLRWLNVSSNALQWFDYAFVPSSLEWLDMGHNRVAELGNFYSLEDFSLRTLLARGNVLSGTIAASSFPSGAPTLARIDLSSNKISGVEAAAFASLPALRAVDLTENEISTLPEQALATNSRESRPSFSLAGNPLSCDCHLAWIRDDDNDDHFGLLSVSSIATTTGIVSDLNSLECVVPFAEGEEEESLPVPVLSVPRSEFLCRYQAHCSSRCMCCDFYACDCRFQCPDGCSCYHDAGWTKNIVQCSARGHSAVPILLPLDATEIRLDGNGLGHIDTQSFLGRANVRELFLNGSQIVSMSNNTFSGLATLEVLHLEDNNIAELRGYEFSSLHFLRDLYLHNNDLVYINEITFDPLRNLRTLTLDGNLLTVFPVWHLLNNPHLSDLTLSRNTWSCECDFIEPFNYFLENKAHSVRDYDRIQCLSDNAIDGAIVGGGGGGRVPCRSSGGNGKRSAITSSSSSSSSQLAVRRGTSVNQIAENEEEQQKVDLVSVMVPLVLAAAVLICGFLAVFVFRRGITEWFYSKASSSSPSSVTYDARPGSSATANAAAANAVSSAASLSSYGAVNGKGGGGKLFDVYVSYSLRDSDFVDQTLAPTLERGTTSYKLCLHQRDFPPSATLYDTVAVAAESSSRVLVVLSRSYLEAEWPLVKAPLRAAVGSGDSGRLVLLLTEDLPAEAEQDPDLAAYVQSCPVVRWGSPGFLNKLRFFLPESAFLTFQRSVTLRQLQQGPQQQQQVVQQVPLPTLPSGGVYHQQQQQQQQHLGFYGPRSDHTYHSIPDTHIYHTLEPRALLKPHLLQQQQQQQMLLMQQQQQQHQAAASLLALSLPPPSSASPQQHPNQQSSSHIHTHSSSSAAQLLPSSAVKRLEEYVV